MKTDTLMNRRLPTHDIFDTLIARRCIEPANVFVELEARAQRPGLAQARRAAEAAVAAGEYTLADIWRRLAADLGLAEAEAAALQALEIEIELDNVLPIADEAARLDGESVLISDMYLPAAAIRALLRRAGVRDDLPLVLTAGGKHHGTVWREFQARGLQCLHVGDNQHSDVTQARRHGMRGRHAPLSLPNALETALRARGFEQTARLLRAARLATPTEGLPDWNAALQAQINLPVLLASSVMLALHMRGQGLRRALFSSRDGRNLKAVFEPVAAALGLGDLESHYWYSSRLARTGGDADYLAYCREMTAEPAVLVDLCGTGVSLAKLVELLQPAPLPQIMVCQFVDDPLLAARSARQCQLKPVPGLNLLKLFSTRNSFSNEVLEFLNFIPEGMVVGVAPVAGHWVPLRHHLEFDDGIAAVVRAQQSYLLRLVARLDRAGIAAAAAELAGNAAALTEALHAALPPLQHELQQMNRFFRPEHHGAEATLAGRALAAAA